MESKTVLMPKELTAENGAKKLFIGEFEESIAITCEECDEGDTECGVCDGKGEYEVPVPVQWATIKQIYSWAVANFGEPPSADIHEELSKMQPFIKP